MAEKDLVIILISSLPDDYNFLITALETIAEEKLTWDYVRDRLLHESGAARSRIELLLVSTRPRPLQRPHPFLKRLFES